MWVNVHVWSVLFSLDLSLGSMMATSIDWTSGFFSLVGSLVFVSFFIILDWFLKFLSKCHNAVASYFGRCFLIFNSGIMDQVARYQLLMELMILDGVDLNLDLCGDFTTSSIISSDTISLTVLWLPTFLIVLIIV